MTNLWLLFLIPFASALLFILLPRAPHAQLKRIALLCSAIPVVLLLGGGLQWIGASIDIPWMKPLAIRFHLAVDTLALLFLWLTALAIPASLFAVRSATLVHPHTFYFLVFVAQGLLFGFFTARDLAFFTLFWEAMLLPLYFIIALWGGQQKTQAAMKFLLYMIAGSALMVAAVVALYLASGGEGGRTFDLDALAKTASSAPYAGWIFAVFILAFAVKTPLFPFHGWLPDAYAQAPFAGTILLSAILSKAGIFGFFRIALAFFPSLMAQAAPWLLALAVAGVLYGALAAWRQTDFKRLLAYSSFSHVNFILAGIFGLTTVALDGALLQSLNHGITIAALFLVAAWLEERLGTTRMADVGGLAAFFPILCWLTLLFVLSSVALPGTNTFVGEFLILYGLFIDRPWLTAILTLSVILAVVYMLRWMQKVYFEEPVTLKRPAQDIGVRELLMALPFAVLVLWIGLYPAPLLKQIETVNHTSESPQ